MSRAALYYPVHERNIMTIYPDMHLSVTFRPALGDFALRATYDVPNAVITDSLLYDTNLQRGLYRIWSDYLTVWRLANEIGEVPDAVLYADGSKQLPLWS